MKEKKIAGAEDDRNLQLLVQTQVTEGSRRQGVKPSPCWYLIPQPARRRHGGQGVSGKVFCRCKLAFRCLHQLCAFLFAENHVSEIYLI